MPHWTFWRRIKNVEKSKDEELQNASEKTMGMLLRLSSIEYVFWNTLIVYFPFENNDNKIYRFI